MKEMLMLSFIVVYPTENGIRAIRREKRDNDKQVTDCYPLRRSEQVAALEIVFIFLRWSKLHESLLL
jgi:hypothetical protein